MRVLDINNQCNNWIVRDVELVRAPRPIAAFEICTVGVVRKKLQKNKFGTFGQGLQLAF